MSNVEIYTKSWCGFCGRAKMLLERKGVPFTEHDIERNVEARRVLQERAPNARTVPQIFIGDHYVGGYSELAAMAFGGELDALLEATAA